MTTEYPQKSTVCRIRSSFFAVKTVYEKSLPTVDDAPKKKRFINVEHHTVCIVALEPCFQLECFG